MLKFNDSMLFIDMILAFPSDVKIPIFSSRVHIFICRCKCLFGG